MSKFDSFQIRYEFGVNLILLKFLCISIISKWLISWRFPKKTRLMADQMSDNEMSFFHNRTKLHISIQVCRYVYKMVIVTICGSSNKTISIYPTAHFVLFSYISFQGSFFGQQRASCLFIFILSFPTYIWKMSRELDPLPVLPEYLLPVPFSLPLGHHFLSETICYSLFVLGTFSLPVAVVVC